MTDLIAVLADSTTVDLSATRNRQRLAATLLHGLEQQFFKELQYVDRLHPMDADYKAAPLVPGVLLQAVHAYEEETGSVGNDKAIKARKAALLLPCVPIFQIEDSAKGLKACDFLDTRTSLWQAMLEGLDTGFMYADYNEVVGLALLKQVPLSERESKAFREVLRVGF